MHDGRLDLIQDSSGDEAGRSFYGDAGNDTIKGYGGNDVIDGGDGNDVTQDWSIPSNLSNRPPVDVTLDGVANDGRPGEGDNVVNVEKFELYVVGRIVGTDAAENIDIDNPGNEGPSVLVPDPVRQRRDLRP